MSGTVVFKEWELHIVFKEADLLKLSGRANIFTRFPPPMLFDVTTVASTVRSHMDFSSHADVRFRFLNEIELLGFHDDLLACVIHPLANQNRL